MQRAGKVDEFACTAGGARNEDLKKNVGLIVDLNGGMRGNGGESHGYERYEGDPADSLGAVHESAPKFRG